MTPFFIVNFVSFTLCKFSIKNYNHHIKFHQYYYLFRYNYLFEWISAHWPCHIIFLKSVLLLCSVTQDSSSTLQFTVNPSAAPHFRVSVMGQETESWQVKCVSHALFLNSTFLPSWMEPKSGFLNFSVVQSGPYSLFLQVSSHRWTIRTISFTF